MKWTPPLTAKGTPCKVCRKGRLCKSHDGKSRQGGAPTVFTMQKKNDFLGAIRAGGPSAKSMAAACRFVGWHEDTLRKWKQAWEAGKASPDLVVFFEEELPRAMEHRRLKTFGVLAKSLESEDERIRADVAKFNAKHFYGDEMVLATQRIAVSKEEEEVEELRSAAEALDAFPDGDASLEDDDEP